MAYNLRHCTDYLINGGLRIIGDDEYTIYSFLKENILFMINEGEICANITETTVTTGGLFGDTYAMLLISHPYEDYLKIGIAMHNNIIMFPMFGSSQNMVAQNKYDHYTKQMESQMQNGSYFSYIGASIKRNFVNVNDFSIMEEMRWYEDIRNCIKQLFRKEDI